MAEVQRNYQRKSLDLNLDISLRILGESTIIKILKILDLSYGGIKISSDKRLDTNVDVAITIKMDDYKLKFIAEVRRCEADENGNFDIGLQYTTISKKNLQKLYQIIK